MSIFELHAKILIMPLHSATRELIHLSTRQYTRRTDYVSSLTFISRSIWSSLKSLTISLFAKLLLSERILNTAVTIWWKPGGLLFLATQYYTHIVYIYFILFVDHPDWGGVLPCCGSSFIINICRWIFWTIIVVVADIRSVQDDNNDNTTTNDKYNDNNNYKLHKHLYDQLRLNLNFSPETDCNFCVSLSDFFFVVFFLYL